MYTAQRVEYSGGQIFGFEGGLPTRTLLSFLINSILGKYNDLVCFVPVVTLDSAQLQKHFMKVLESILQIGFHASKI